MTKKTPEKRRARALQKRFGWNYTFALAWVREYGATSEDMTRGPRNLEDVIEQDALLAQSQSFTDTD